MKIGSWNINWEREGGASAEERNEINFKKSRIINRFIKCKYDIVALLEAEDREAPEIEGYKKCFYERDDKYGGILLYIDRHYEPRIYKSSLEEFKRNKSECFLPAVVNIGSNKVHILFVWPTAKSTCEKFYGFERFNEIFNKNKTKFEKTRDFLNGEKHNVIVIGDFNILYKKEWQRADMIRKQKWYEFLDMMKQHGLIWKENDKNTFHEIGANDHCFVSKGLYELTNFDVKAKNYMNVETNHIVESDHNFISVTIDQDKLLAQHL